MALRSFAILSALVSAVLAQSPYIPSGINETCSSYLTSLNNNAGFSACTTPFTSALEQFAPGDTPSISASIIDSVLGQLCSSTAFSGCPQSTVTTQLSSFYAACQSELTSTPVELVRTIYDALFTLVPIRQAICAKDDNGNYCAADLSNVTSTENTNQVDSPQTLLSQFLYSAVGTSTATRRDTSGSTSALVPNATTYEATNLLFMFLQPSLSAAKLCTTCTRNVLTPYITFESNSPYGPGIGNSPLLAGQVALYENITAKCPSGFLSGAVQAAGGLSGGLMSGAAPRVASQELSVAVGAILGIAALVASSSIGNFMSVGVYTIG